MLQNVAVIVSTIRLAENDDLEASDSIFANWPYYRSSWGYVRISLKYLQNVALIISTIRLAESNHSEASDSILQIGYPLGRNGAK